MMPSCSMMAGTGLPQRCEVNVLVRVAARIRKRHRSSQLVGLQLKTKSFRAHRNFIKRTELYHDNLSLDIRIPGVGLHPTAPLPTQRACEHRLAHPGFNQNSVQFATCR
jgi:hypothetical protein